MFQVMQHPASCPDCDYEISVKDGSKIGEDWGEMPSAWTACEPIQRGIQLQVEMIDAKSSRVTRNVVYFSMHASFHNHIGCLFGLVIFLRFDADFGHYSPQSSPMLSAFLSSILESFTDISYRLQDKIRSHRMLHHLEHLLQHHILDSSCFC